VRAARSKAQEVIGIWNDAAQGTTLPSARLTPQREKIIRVRLKEKGWLEDFRAAYMFLRSSGFHCGQNDRGWIASVDFVLQAGKATELAEKGQTISATPANGNGNRRRAVVPDIYGDENPAIVMRRQLEGK